MVSKETLVTIYYEKDGEIAEHAVPEPTTYSGTTSIITDSGISVSGHLLGTMVRSDVAKIAMSWNYLSVSEWMEINQLFKDEFIRPVEFFDQTAGKWDTRSMYISDRSAGMWRRDTDGRVLGWTGCSLQLTEV